MLTNTCMSLPKVYCADIVYALQRNGQSISWIHVEHLYLTETETTGGVRLCPKITRDHLWLTSYSRMRVYLAAQVSEIVHGTATALFFGDGHGSYKHGDDRTVYFKTQIMSETVASALASVCG